MSEFIPALKQLQTVAQGIGVPELAADFDIAASSLYAMLNPYGEKNIRLVRALHIMARAGDFSPLDLYLNRHGFKIVKSEADPDGEDLRHESLQALGAASDFIQGANDPSMLYESLVALRRSLSKENDDVLERRRPGFEGQVTNGGKWRNFGVKQ